MDLITHVAALQDFHAVERELGSRGFAHDMSEDAPICRWRVGGVVVDVMPTDESILGFANRWYPLAVVSAHPVVLPSKTEIRLVAPPVFIATKFEAFADRGKGDFLFSHDLGDLIAVVDGRDSLISECQTSDDALKSYLCDRFLSLVKEQAFWDALPGHLMGDAASQARLPDLENKLRALADLA